jgi:hypothetical protein
MDTDDLERRFTYHPPKGDQAERYSGLRERGHQMAKHINASAPDSREKSLAITSLEEAIMWANAAIARNE